MIKFLAHLLFPIPVCIEILLAGLFMLWFTKKQKLGKAIITIGVILLLLFSSYPFSYFLLRSLEKQYTTLNDNDILSNYSDIKYIVILGGAIAYDERLPIISQFYSSSLARIMEGIRLSLKLSDIKLIVSGGGFHPVTSAELMAKLSEEFKVNRDDIIIENESLNTYEEALFIKDIVKNDNFLLVTSASHMPRAMALFEKYGMKPIAAPTDHWIKENQFFDYNRLFPNASNLNKTEVAFYEYLGLVKEKLMGHL